MGLKFPNFLLNFPSCIAALQPKVLRHFQVKLKFHAHHFRPSLVINTTNPLGGLYAEKQLKKRFFALFPKIQDGHPNFFWMCIIVGLRWSPTLVVSTKYAQLIIKNATFHPQGAFCWLSVIHLHQICTLTMKCD